MDYKRPDGRLPNELRDIVISFDGLDGVDGSARFGFGETKALSSVSGPMEVRLAVEQASRATFEVIVRPLAGLAGTDSKALASTLRSALLPSLILTSNPRTLVQLVALALSPVPSLPTLSPSSSPALSRALRISPALIAALINASTLALLNASSIPLRGVVCAASVGRVRTAGELIVDPTEVELGSGVLDGVGTFAFLITGSKSSSSPQGLRGTENKKEETEQKLKAELVWSRWTAAPSDGDELACAIELARAGAFRVREHMKDAIERHLSGSGKETVNVKKEATVKVEPLDDEKMEIS